MTTPRTASSLSRADFDSLVLAIQRVIRDGRERGVSRCEHLSQIIAGMDKWHVPDETYSGCLPPVVVQHLHRTPELAATSVDRDLAAAILACAPGLRWRRAGYENNRDLADFNRAYAFAVVYGPRTHPLGDSVLHIDSALVGFALQGPGLLYPSHVHATDELYYIIGGTAAWRHGEGDWQRTAPGTFVFIESEVPHATRTFQEPLLTLFAWTSDLGSLPRLVAEP